MENKIGIVFIHGAGLGSFIWDELKPHLMHRVLMLDFPNRMNRGGITTAHLHLGDYAGLLIKRIEKWNHRRFIIVAHSAGGCVGMKVAQHFGSRVQGFVAISAAIPLEGGSFVSCFPFPKNILNGLLIRIMGTKLPNSLIVKHLCHGLPPDKTKKVLTAYTAESKALFLERTNAKLLNMTTLYIQTTRDKIFSKEFQQKMAKNMVAQEIVSMKTGHLPMLTMPQKLAEILNEFIEKLPPPKIQRSSNGRGIRNKKEVES
jgi:pimeloyl-ACP methyl ester carboxylesterase